MAAVANPSLPAGQNEAECLQLMAAALASAAEGVVIVDAQGRLVFMNESGERISRRRPSPASTIEEQAADSRLRYPDGRPMPTEETPLGRALRGETVVDFPLLIRQPDGRDAYIRNTANPVRDAQGNLIGAISIFNDASHSRQVKRALRLAIRESREHRAESEALLEGSRAVLQHQDFAESARAIFGTCKRLVGVRGGYVALMSEDGTANQALFLDSGGQPCTVDPTLPMPIRGMRERVFRLCHTEYCNDFASSKWQGLLPTGHLRINNVLFAPLVIRGRAVGLIGLANKRGGFTDKDARIASAFGELVAVALQNSWSLESLEHSEERFRSLAQSAIDAIVCVDGQGSITFWNSSAETIFGYTAAEAIGRPIALVLPERFWQAFQEEVAEVAQGRSPRILGRTVEGVGRHAGGEEFPFELALSSWKTREGTFYTAIIRDITERKRAEYEREQAVRLQRELMFLASHEFRTPLTVVLGNLDLALRRLAGLGDEAMPQVRIRVEKARAAARRLSIMLDEVLDVSAIEIGLLDLTFEALSPSAVAYEVLERLRSVTAHHQVKAEIDPDLPPVMADRRRIGQTLANLVSNAAKYSPEGTTITVGVQHQDEHVEFSVSDQGQGIAAGEIPRVFDRFYRVGALDLGLKEGLGLGLYIGRAVVEAHGGRIWLESTLGKGATFRFRLPFPRLSPAP